MPKRKHNRPKTNTSGSILDQKTHVGLEQLFGSKTRTLLLRLFFNNTDKVFYVRELSRRIGMQINAVRRELDNLTGLNLLLISSPNQDLESAKETAPNLTTSYSGKWQKKYYCLNRNFILYPELKSLILKSQMLTERKFIEKLKRLGVINFLVLAGKFVGCKGAPLDLLVVGRLNRKQLKKMIKDFEKELCEEINYTVMSKQEFKYRKDVTDRFLYNILEKEKIVIIDNLTP